MKNPIQTSTIKTSLIVSLILAGTVAVTGCANNQPVSNSSEYSSYPNTQRADESRLGMVEAIDIVRAEAGSSGVGAVVGGLIGGLVGNQVGGGTGNTAATVAGAVGGAVVGNNVEKNRNANAADRVQIRVRLDRGESLTIVQDSVNNVRVGDRVRVVDNRVYRY